MRANAKKKAILVALKSKYNVKEINLGPRMYDISLEILQYVDDKSHRDMVKLLIKITSVFFFFAVIV